MIRFFHYRACDSAETVHPECDPIPIPPRDHYYPEVNITDGNRFCFPFMRSLPGQQTLGKRPAYGFYNKIEI